VSTTRKVGAIARLFPDRVFGFIHCPEDARDYFFHQSQLDGCTFGQLKEGDTLTFSLGESPKDGKIEAQEIQLDQAKAPVETPSRRRAR
jgi:cold shock CspA family protein